MRRALLAFATVCSLALVSFLLAPAAGAQLRFDARAGAAGQILVEVRDNWPHTGVPSLEKVEVGDFSFETGEGSVDVYLQGQPGGGAAITAYRVDSQIGGLFGGDYTVSLYIRDHAGEPAMLTAQEVVTVSDDCRPGFGGSIEDESLCLNEGRFRVRAFYRVPPALEQEAHARPLANDSGAFWFFNPDNLELIVKVLDGCAAFDRFWVFAGGLTNVGVRLEVTDTWTNETWDYQTQPGEGFEPVRDTDAFDTCDAVR